MKKQRFCAVTAIAAALLALAAASAAAQSGQSADSLVRRLEGIAGRWETLARQTGSLTSWSRVHQQTLDKLEDDNAALNNDLQYAQYQGAQFDEKQSKRVVEAARRIENAKGQIQRNIARLQRDYGN
jgi:hypothetical protein